MKSKKITAFATYVAMFIVCTGCATIFSKSRYDIPIAGSPAGATVVIKSRSILSKEKVFMKRTAPFTAELKASIIPLIPTHYTVEVTHPGHSSSYFEIRSTIDPWIIANIFNGGWGLILDAATGAMYKIPPRKMMQYNLNPSEARIEGIKSSFSVVDFNSLSEETRSELDPIPGISLKQKANK